MQILGQPFQVSIFPCFSKGSQEQPGVRVAQGAEKDMQRVQDKDRMHTHTQEPLLVTAHQEFYDGKAAWGSVP